LGEDYKWKSEPHGALGIIAKNKGGHIHESNSRCKKKCKDEIWMTVTVHVGHREHIVKMEDSQDGVIITDDDGDSRFQSESISFPEGSSIYILEKNAIE
jgi:hypothetical protein